MLELLAEAEEELPELLLDEEAWCSLYIDYEPPTALRLWRAFGSRRIMLHCIEPCENPLFHPHPWSSAVHVLEGAYEMRIGYEHLSEFHVPTVTTVVLPAGSKYEMCNPRGWHYVKPLEGPSWSTMIVGSPSPSRELPMKPKNKLGPLSDTQRQMMFEKFRTFFP